MQEHHLQGGDTRFKGIDDLERSQQICHNNCSTIWTLQHEPLLSLGRTAKFYDCGACCCHNLYLSSPSGRSDKNRHNSGDSVRIVMMGPKYKFNVPKKGRSRQLIRTAGRLFAPQGQM